MTRSVTSPHTRHLASLDGLRGIAALMVVALHMGLLLGPALTPRSGHLAVDFFFCLSGFVLCYAYRDRLDAGLSARSFMLLRLIRLGPLFLCGMSLGLGAALMTIAVGGTSLASSARDNLIGIVGLIGLPAPVFRTSVALYPLNVPAWSLFLEIVANGIFALSYRYLSKRVAAIGMVISLLAILVSSTLFGGLMGGNDWHSVQLGIARVCWSFPLGGVVFAIWSRGGLPLLSRFAWVTYPLLVLLLFVDVPATFRPAYDLACVCIAFPAIVLAAAQYRDAGIVSRAERSLGKASYAIYITHVPIGFVYAAALSRISGGPAQYLAPWCGLIFLPLIFGIALFLDRYVDLPIRRFLTRRHRASPRRLKDEVCVP